MQKSKMEGSISIADIRKDYKLQSLNEADVAKEPMEQFTRWWEEAVNSSIDEVNAMTLATATPQGLPSARTVLLKGYDERGFIFYTNYESHKGTELEANPHAALVLFWKELERQVRIEGTVVRISGTESDAYFHTRPVGSRIGAWASPQSTIVPNREAIENRYQEFEQSFADKEIPRPPHWGGYLVQPTRIEFWQGRSSRLHDRIRYSLQSNGIWTMGRLAP